MIPHNQESHNMPMLSICHWLLKQYPEALDALLGDPPERTKLKEDVSAAVCQSNDVTSLIVFAAKLDCPRGPKIAAGDQARRGARRRVFLLHSNLQPMCHKAVIAFDCTVLEDILTASDWLTNSNRRRWSSFPRATRA